MPHTRRRRARANERMKRRCPQGDNSRDIRALNLPQPYPIIARNSSSESMFTPSFSAFSNLEGPILSPATR
jgi:hypothetical protein